MAETVGNGAATATSTTTFEVSVLRCRKTGRVLLLEAGKDFVDTLFSFLLLPIGIIIHMLKNAGGRVKALDLGISSLHKSVEKLDRSFLHVDKASLTQIRPAVVDTCVSTGLLQCLEAGETKPRPATFELPGVYYRTNCVCYGSQNKLSSTRGTRCTHGCGTYNQEMRLLSGDRESLEKGILDKLVHDLDLEKATCSSDRGFVRENVTYMVTDNLEVMPSTTVRCIQVLNKLKVATLADLESTDVSIGIIEILQLLQAALSSSTCLDDIFTKK
ncbi:uncharacterized protein [Physcomitrium patens]|uniref:Uncharacterized protein n=1 Tax=Physcomitrium patens TaxID=3218 RepID=A9TDA8_PHYPA|nr:uncharacterized protein LOC112295907 isoform X2 [Physcomitrium patens]PNR33704.1 hypothetical protein PHYPA_023520 [Physcomitrium patens]|eukprot:XP_024403708.1 uncharacterized protein LOC112295907 isoform X2 [Physcomitrella patens]